MTRRSSLYPVMRVMAAMMEVAATPVQVSREMIQSIMVAMADALTAVS